MYKRGQVNKKNVGSEWLGVNVTSRPSIWRRTKVGEKWRRWRFWSFTSGEVEWKNAHSRQEICDKAWQGEYDRKSRRLQKAVIAWIFSYSLLWLVQIFFHIVKTDCLTYCLLDSPRLKTITKSTLKLTKFTGNIMINYCSIPPTTSHISPPSPNNLHMTIMKNVLTLP